MSRKEKKRKRRVSGKGNDVISLGGGDTDDIGSDAAVFLRDDERKNIKGKNGQKSHKKSKAKKKRKKEHSSLNGLNASVISIPESPDIVEARTKLTSKQQSKTRKLQKHESGSDSDDIICIPDSPLENKSHSKLNDTESKRRMEEDHKLALALSKQSNAHESLEDEKARRIAQDHAFALKLQQSVSPTASTLPAAARARDFHHPRAVPVLPTHHHPQRLPPNYLNNFSAHSHHQPPFHHRTPPMPRHIDASKVEMNRAKSREDAQIRQQQDEETQLSMALDRSKAELKAEEEKRRIAEEGLKKRTAELRLQSLKEQNEYRKRTLADEPPSSEPSIRIKLHLPSKNIIRRFRNDSKVLQLFCWVELNDKRCQQFPYILTAPLALGKQLALSSSDKNIRDKTMQELDIHSCVFRLTVDDEENGESDEEKST